MKSAALAGLGLLVALFGPGCGRTASSPPAAAADTAFTRGFGPPVGRGRAPRVDAFFAPGAQSAVAWLPDGSFWNGDFELALLDARDTLLALSTPEPAGPHAQVPAARRAGPGFEVRGFMPWTRSPADTAGWVRLQVRATRAGVETRIAVRSGGEAAHPLHPYAPLGERFVYEAREGRLLRDGRTIALVAPAAGSSAGGPPIATPASGDSVSALARRSLVRLAATAPGATWDVWLAPVGGTPAKASPPDRRLAFAASFKGTAVAWKAELARGASIEHPDPRVQAAFVTAQRLTVGNRERRNGQTNFLGSPFQYRDLYLRDGARVVNALALLGRADLAGQALTSLYAFQWPGGAFLSQRGQLDGTGQALWALATFASLGGNPRLVDRLLDPAVRGARWIAAQRGSSALRGGPAAGLLPYADPRDNELVRGHLLGNDAWALGGLEALVPLLRARGRAATADTVAAEARAYRARLIAVWDGEARHQGRPLPPVLEGEGRDWGNLSAAYPCGVFAVDDARAVALDRFLRARASADGLLTYGGRDSVHHYLGFDRTQAALRRGERTQFLVDLAAILDHAQPDGSGFELAARDGSFGDNLPSHGTFAAMYVDLVRCSLVYERGDSLVLLAGAPSGQVALRAAPTRFGKLDLAIRSEADGRGASLVATLPAPALVLWPPPQHVRAVTGADGTTRPLADGSFTLPKGRGAWHVEFEPAAGGGEAR